MFFNLLSYGSSENYDNDFFSDPGFPGGDPGGIPIDDYIIPAIIMMALYVFYKQYYKKHRTQ
jgi:hypothetical protein